ncbi:MAG: sigma-70 family RNA polymerase sigma factor [Planctomycetes bacterium]|nr:sigma-70 family RNA polymerase sigma factor [Planctomycetota bacterium]
MMSSSLATVDRPETWVVMVRRLAKKFAARRFRDEVISDTLLAIVQRVRSKRPLDRLVAFAKTIVRRLAIRAAFRERLHREVDADTVAGSPVAPDDHGLGRPVIRIASLRGDRQRWLCRRVLARWSCERMAEASGLNVGEVRRQVLELSSKILSLTQTA